MVDALTRPGPTDPARAGVVCGPLPDSYSGLGAIPAFFQSGYESFQDPRFLADLELTETEPPLAAYARTVQALEPSPSPSPGPSPGPSAGAGPSADAGPSPVAGTGSGTLPRTGPDLDDGPLLGLAALAAAFAACRLRSPSLRPIPAKSTRSGLGIRSLRRR
ncbi:hypothetical protein BH24ACT3_BH24ACT3_17940 [soil metagenome]